MNNSFPAVGSGVMVRESKNDGWLLHRFRTIDENGFYTEQGGDTAYKWMAHPNNSNGTGSKRNIKNQLSIGKFSKQVIANIKEWLEAAESVKHLMVGDVCQNDRGEYFEVVDASKDGDEILAIFNPALPFNFALTAAGRLTKIGTTATHGHLVRSKKANLIEGHELNVKVTDKGLEVANA